MTDAPDLLSAQDAIEQPSDASGSSTALVILPKSDLVFVPGGSAPLLATIRAHATAEAAKLDVTKPKDRDAIASLVWKLRRTKTAIDDAGKTLKSDYQTKITPIDAERRAAREGMDVLIEEIDAPLTAFKMREELRLRGHQTTLTEIEGWADVPEDWTAAQITARIEELKVHPHLDRQWEEYETKAKSAVRNAYNSLVAARVVAQEREAEAVRQAEAAQAAAGAEALRLAQEQQAREQRAAQAAAEAATRAAEAKAQQQAEEAAAAAQALLDAAAARERAQAEALAAAEVDRLAGLERERAAAERAEAARVSAHERALEGVMLFAVPVAPYTAAMYRGRLAIVEQFPRRDWEEFSDRAASVYEHVTNTLRHMIEVAETAEAEAVETRRQREAAAEIERQAEAKARERAAAEAATQAEQRRVAQIAADKKAADDWAAAEAKRISENKTHRAGINREVLAALIGCGMTEEIGRIVISSVVRGEIPHMKIEY